MSHSNFHIKPLWIYLLGGITALLAPLSFALQMPELSALPLLFLLFWFAITYPVYYVILTASLVPLSIQIDDIGAGLGISLPTEPLMIGFWLLLLLRFAIYPQIDRSFFKHPIFIAASLYLFWYLVTTLTSTMPVTSLKSFIARTWFAGVFFYFFSQRLHQFKILKTFLIVMIIGSTLLVGYTLIRHAGENFVRLHSYTIMRPFFNDHGIYAAYIAFFLPVVIAFAWFGKSFGFSSFWRIILGLLALLFLLGIVFSYTRATWISIVGMVILGLLVRYGVTFKQMMGALALILLLFLWQNERILYELSRNKQDSAEQLEDHIKSVSNISTDPSNLERINRWKSAVEMAKEKPVLGFGPYTYTYQYAPFQRPEDLTLISTHAGTLGNAHSEYFMALSEMGIPGLLFLLALFLSSLYVGIKVYKEALQPHIRILAISITLGLMTYYIHGLLNNYTEYDKIAVPLWSFLAILTALDLYYPKINQAKATHEEAG